MEPVNGHMSDTVNLLDISTEPRAGRPEGYRRQMLRVGELLGAAAIGASLYDLEPGQSVSPYHYEHGNEEWLLVVAGHPTMRRPGGEEALQPWDVVCFADGPDGAHKVTNRTREPARVLMLSTKHKPALFVYPDSGKIGVVPPGKLFRLADDVDYWHGEQASG
jgi:uncharacterized cupin superfamily protein